MSSCKQKRISINFMKLNVIKLGGGSEDTLDACKGNLHTHICHSGFIGTFMKLVTVTSLLVINGKHTITTWEKYGQADCKHKGMVSITGS